MKRYQKLISLLLVLTLVLSLCPTVFAVDGDKAAELSEETVIFPESNISGEAEFEPVEIEPMPTEEDNFPEVEEPVEPEEAEEPEEPEEAEESAGADEDEDAEETEKLFPGMPENYVLSADQIEAKRKLAENNVLGVLSLSVPNVDYVDGEVFFLADTLEYAQEVAAAYGAELVKYEYGVATLSLNGATVLEAVSAGSDINSNLPVVEANYIQHMIPITDVPSLETYAFTAAGVPVKSAWKTWFDTTSNPDKYLSDPSSSDYQYMHDTVNSYEAWNTTKGSGVTVAVIDSGVTPTHEDLNANVIARETVNSSWGTAVSSSHGTHVAGIIAAQMGNGKGGAGIAPDAKIYSVRVFEDNSGSQSNIISGVNKAVSAKRSGTNIKVMNMSLGGYFYSSSYETAVRNAVNAGITVVVAMGNDGSNIKCYPAAFNIPGVIAVQSTTAANTLSYFSNYGSWADVSAPGSSILSTVPGGYSFMSGTSMATPVVSGICALYLSMYPNASPVQVEAAVKAATNKGIVDAAKLFGSQVAAPSIYASSYTNADGTLPYNSTITIRANDSSKTLIYTLDGKAPSIKSDPVVGTLYNGSSLTLSINSANGFIPGTTVKISAAAISSSGEMSKVASYSVKVGYAAAQSVTITTTNACVLSGKTLTMAANVYPAEAKQDVRWEIVSRSGCKDTTIDSAKGILKVGKNDSGYVKVIAASVDGNKKSSQVTVNIGTPVLTKKLSLSCTSLSLFTNSTSKSSPYQLTASSFGADGSKLNGRTFTWTSSNTKVVTVDGNGRISTVGTGSAKITCLATDGTNVKATCSVKVVSSADSLAISGYSSVAPGSTASYSVTILPKAVKDKTVIWSVSDSSKASIDSKGKLTVRAYSGSFKLRAETPLGVYAEKTVTITSNKSYIRLNASNVTLFSASQAGSTSYQISNLGSTYSELEWSSSNTKVANVDKNGLVTAVAAGKATITCKALDAGKSSASVSITVVNPVSSVTVVSKSATSFSRASLLSGKSASNVVYLGDAFGTPTNTKVKWDYEVSGTDSSGNIVSFGSYTSYAKANKLFSINGSGTLTAAKNAANMMGRKTSNNIVVSAVATTTDGTYLSGRADYDLIASPISSISLYYKGYYSGITFNGWPKNEEIDVGVYCRYGGYSRYTFNDWTVSSSNPDVAGAFKDGSKVIIITGQKSGSAKITITASDGSNKKATMTVKVK